MTAADFLALRQLLDSHPMLWTARDAEGCSFLHWGALAGDAIFLSHCISTYRLPVDSIASDGQTPLMWAVHNGRLRAARLLLDSHANPRMQSKLGATPLMVAVQRGQHEMLLLLCHRDLGTMKQNDAHGCAAMHWAAYKGDERAAKLLHYFGADILALDDSKWLPLHHAAVAGHLEVMRFLLERRSDPAARDAKGCTALELVREHSKVDATLLELLRVPGPSVDITSTSNLLADLEDDVYVTLPVLPLAWICLVSVACLHYLRYTRHLCWKRTPCLCCLFEVGAPLNLILFLYARSIDPGKLPSKCRGASGVEELLQFIDSDACDSSERPGCSRLCTATWIIKGPRTKYCTWTHSCIEEFDHNCHWLGVPIGRGNHRVFCVLAIAESVTQVVYIALCWLNYCGHVSITNLSFLEAFDLFFSPDKIFERMVGALTDVGNRSQHDRQ
eukprot:gnl/TRDRNA2_/TRDRNA2_136289_c1_seq4.p1 gnl/TRDRNA2_/TRDRNA2_136289_c1~~gnl/TRDRNA2_/TRDRNA2_136289_c1_seq4.p1  ORF type:complete len:454 (+),score=42.86 gnl/TRDRNA2_/TRDRNA2_136289_c1_seq4:28-1362(+)